MLDRETLISEFWRYMALYAAVVQSLCDIFRPRFRRGTFQGGPHFSAHLVPPARRHRTHSFIHLHSPAHPQLLVPTSRLAQPCNFPPILFSCCSCTAFVMATKKDMRRADLSAPPEQSSPPGHVPTDIALQSCHMPNRPSPARKATWLVCSPGPTSQRTLF
jgi:hypothetical protein